MGKTRHLECVKPSSCLACTGTAEPVAKGSLFTENVPSNLQLGYGGRWQHGPRAIQVASSQDSCALPRRLLRGLPCGMPSPSRLLPHMPPHASTVAQRCAFPRRLFARCHQVAELLTSLPPSLPHVFTAHAVVNDHTAREPQPPARVVPPCCLRVARPALDLAGATVACNVLMRDPQCRR